MVQSCHTDAHKIQILNYQVQAGESHPNKGVNAFEFKHDLLSQQRRTQSHGSISYSDRWHTSHGHDIQYANYY